MCVNISVHILLFNSLSLQNDGWLSGSDDSCVRRYAKSSTELESLVTQTSSFPVRCIAVDPKGKCVAVTSECVCLTPSPRKCLSNTTHSEPIVKIINLEDTTDIKALNGHSRGVRRATWHPSGSILVSIPTSHASHIQTHLLWNRRRVVQMAKLSLGISHRANQGWRKSSRGFYL